MRLVKCDRCGKIMNPLEAISIDINLNRYNQKYIPYFERSYDVCEECRDKFIEYIIDFWHSHPNSVFVQKEDKKEE